MERLWFFYKNIYLKSMQILEEDMPHDLADFDTYHRVRGLKWPVVDGKETFWRFNTKYDPYAKMANPNSDFAFMEH